MLQASQPWLPEIMECQSGIPCRYAEMYLLIISVTPDPFRINNRIQPRIQDTLLMGADS